MFMFMFMLPLLLLPPMASDENDDDTAFDESPLLDAAMAFCQRQEEKVDDDARNRSIASSNPPITIVVRCVLSVGWLGWVGLGWVRLG